MFFYKVLSRISGTICRTSLLSASRKPRQQYFSTFSNHLHSQPPSKLNPFQVNWLCPSISSSTPRFGFSSSASTESNDKEKGNNVHNVDSSNDDPAKTSEEAKEIDQDGQAKPADQTEESGSVSDSQSQTVKRRRSGVKRTAFSDSDSDSESGCDLSRDDLAKLVTEKEELLMLKHKEIEEMKDKVLRTYAEMENVMDRTRREAENSKKFAIQNFVKSLLDVADNLGRASSVVKESFSKIDTSSDSAEAVKLLKTLLDGVEMTEKQLSEVLKKFGVEKFDPTNEPFDPHRHNAVFQIPDGSKPPGTVAAVLKAGYILHDRVIRPAEVGVTQAVEENNPAE